MSSLAGALAAFVRPARGWAGMMLARALVLALAASPSVAVAKTKKTAASDKKKKKKRTGEDEDRGRGPATLDLDSIDLGTGRAIVRVGGVSRAPDARLFSFHDDRDRHYIALFARCEPTPEVPPAFRCELEVPRIYLERGNLVGLTVHLRSREVAAAEVPAKWAAARQALPPGARRAPSAMDPLPSPRGDGVREPTRETSDEVDDEPEGQEE